MAIRGGRKLVVGPTTYHWIIQAPRDRYSTGWTAGTISLIVRGDNGTNQKFMCRSKHWTPEHEQAFQGASEFNPPPHRVAFSPGLVRQVIDQGLVACELEDWSVLLNPRQSTIGEPAPWVDP